MSDPLNAGQYDLRMIDILKARIPDIARLEPWELRADVGCQVGSLLHNVGLFHEATNLLFAALELNQRRRPDSPETAYALYCASWCFFKDMSDAVSASSFARKALDIYENAPQRDPLKIALVCNALGVFYMDRDADLPKALKSIVLSEEDSALEPEQKTALARRIVHDTAYYEQKNRVRANMAECVEVLKTGTYGTQQDMTAKFRRDLLLMGALIVIQSLAVFLMMWLTRHLGVNPVLRAVDHIKKDQTIPIVGASEFRYLAGTYNVMYSAYKKSIENLNFKASHDELTGVYNRAGYELIRTSVDLSSTAMLLFDADTFKEINDTFGHETGDRVLKKISAALKNNFRSDDYICRIGGDEFVVFMVHISGDPGKLIEDKVIRINQELSNVADGLPPITLSAGVSFDPENTDPAEMFRQADIALYYVKDNGRNDCCFYSDALKGKSKPE